LAGEAAEGWTPETPVPIRYDYEDAAALYKNL
jgi:hypothetical protein